MLVTSLTTAVAFAATSLSKIVPISTFGIFAAIIVPINYMLVILAFPPFVIVHEKYLKNRCRWDVALIRLCGKCKRGRPSRPS